MQQLNTQTIKPGFRFKNNSMRLPVVLCDGTDKRNLALLVRENDTCPYITVRDLSETKTGDFDWAWGHYFSNFDDAFEDYRVRLSELQ